MAEPSAWMLYASLVGNTAGALLHLFLAMLLYRRRGRLERLLFATVLALFVMYSGFLLSVNLAIHYQFPPQLTFQFANLLSFAGWYAFWGLLVHVHAEYRQKVLGSLWPLWLKVLTGLSYLPFVWGISQVIAELYERSQMGLPLALEPFWIGGDSILLVPILALCALFQESFARLGSGRERQFHYALTIFFAVVAALNAASFFVNFDDTLFGAYQIATAFWPLVPSSVIAYLAVRRNFLQLGEQRNIVYTVSAGFLALLYLTVALRVSTWLEDYLPPVATLSILLFVLVVLFEPIQRWVGQWLRRSFREHVERNQRLSAEFQNEARQGNLQRLVEFAAARIRDEFQLTAARIELGDTPDAGAGHGARVFPLRLGDGASAALVVSQDRGSLSADTAAALEHLAGQLAPALDLCRLLEEKLKLERELAERERLALVGQMAASISHNLKNPLSSMKTLLQVQLENPELPEALRNDCRMIVGEVDRLGAKLSQLLLYAKPALRGAGARVDAAALLEQSVALLRHDAERRGISLEYARPESEVWVVANEAALSDIVSNLVVNAIEALGQGGRVRVSLAVGAPRGLGAAPTAPAAVLEITDDGPGISAEAREKIFEPFYTTKPSGTGLGLAIVARRLGELKGGIECTSPVAEGRGTRFTVTLPLA